VTVGQRYPQATTNQPTAMLSNRRARNQ